MRELALLFLRLGLTAFGGPAAHIAKMDDEFVHKRQWLTQPEFLDLISAANLIPGPNSTEVAIHIGYRRGRWPGLLIAGAAFILPAALLVTAIAWSYVRYGKVPVFQQILYAVKPVIIVIIGQALIRFTRSVCTTWRAALWVGACVALAALGVNELLVLLIGALLGLATTPRATLHTLTSLLFVPPIALATVATVPIVTAPLLFLAFLKIGAVLFGSGYVLVAFLRTDFVERYHWLTQQQLLDSIAVGQITPGPVFTTATFIGYLLLGPAGAVVATVGIFLPAFCFVALTAPILYRLRSSVLVRRILDGVNAASLALMAVVTLELLRTAIVDVFTLTIALASAVALFRFSKMRSDWLLLAAALLGVLRQFYSP